MTFTPASEKQELVELTLRKGISYSNTSLEERCLVGVARYTLHQRSQTTWRLGVLAWREFPVNKLWTLVLRSQRCRYKACIGSCCCWGTNNPNQALGQELPPTRPQFSNAYVQIKLPPPHREKCHNIMNIHYFPRMTLLYGVAEVCVCVGGGGGYILRDSLWNVELCSGGPRGWGGVGVGV